MMITDQTDDNTKEPRQVPLYPAETFARRLVLAVLRELAPHKQSTLAVRLGVSQPRVSQIMSARHTLSVAMLERLLIAAEALTRAEGDK